MLRININGITRVSTDKNGNILGARKGSKYAMNVNIAKTILKKNAIWNCQKTKIFSFMQTIPHLQVHS